MPVVNPEALWQELKDPRFTTPVLPEWMPYVEQELRKAYFLQGTHNYNCSSGILTLINNDFDTIVSDGIKNGKIHIPFKQEVAA